MSVNQSESSPLVFRGGSYVLLFPVLAFVAFTVYLFIFEQAFDLMGLALALSLIHI